MIPSSIFVSVLNDGGSDPVEGAVVQVFTEDGSSLLDTGTTDEDGEVEVFTPTVGRFWVRTHFPDIVFSSQTFIEVSASLQNHFDVVGQNRFTTPLPTLSGLCRVSGTLRKLDATPAGGVPVVFKLVQEERKVGFYGSLLVSSEIRVKSGVTTGRVEADLMQDALYEVTYPGSQYGEEAAAFSTVVRTPSEPSISLLDLLYPRTISIRFSVNMLSLSPGDSAEVDVEILRSNNISLPYVLYDKLDPALLYRLTCEGRGASARWKEDRTGLIIEAGEVGTATFSFVLESRAKVDLVPAQPPVIEALVVEVVP